MSKARKRSSSGATAKRRQTIGSDPFDVVVPRQAEKPMSSVPRKPRKVRATFHLPEDLLGEARDAVTALMGPPLHLTLAELAENALRREVARLKKARNRGKNFPRRRADLKGGRRIGS